MQDYPLTLCHVFHRAERLWRDKEIVTVTKNGARERTTYGDWAERTRRVAGALDELGVSADGRVGTFAWNSARHLELYFAAPCTGRVLHTLNIRLFPEQVVYVANHAEDEVVFVDRSLLPLFWPLVDELKTVRHVIVMDDGDGPEIPDDPRVLDYEELLARSARVDRFHVADENSAAAMCYTSGTTGNPKGVVYSHRSMTLHAMATMLSDTFGLSERDVVLPVVPQFHANAWGLAHAVVMTGASIIMPGPDLSAPAIAKLMVEENVTVAAGVPTIWMGVLPELEGKELPHLRHVLCGGSAVPRALSEAYRKQIGLPILQAWGMTETSPIGSVATIRSSHADLPEEDLAALRATVGITSPLVDVRIVEPGADTELPWDGKAQGELQVAGPWIAAGYYRDERSAGSFSEDGWLRTGDVATIDEHGYIRLVDRTKDVIKSGGEWISSVELENEIMGHPDVAEAAVIGVPDARWGERPLACVVAKDGATLDADAIRGYLDGRVAKWWIPERVEMIDEVPKTSVGKFSKKDLRERFTGEATGATKAVETA
ncbi:long-chain fatty acid--CoA ligase [Paraconexibacter antarcticus]|uniref:Long-chain fatty acid--CoA ligase n=1 Tax=Paraconexibacter antarcticus TaxID=2949664 RepID=A0ABY5DNH5_9ACTN|nr:long-chain fatty acid--CoA ligase [Paraconexibacter antarcticus]UTI62357.1 long-chain fatty acid--CoA ligase [Paraconexibacter antarcticus]